MTLGGLLKILNSDRFKLKPRGFFNVENSNFTITNGYFDSCDCHIETLGQSSCQECG